jgi:RHS repeat-associated protein
MSREQGTALKDDNSRTDGPNSVPLPTVSLPKGGGAIRGVGEKFAANLVTGTGSLTIPLAASPGRSGFGPQLSLSYDSAAGNGPFGFGWSISLPSITRKTDKGLPQYQDAEESDVFVLSGAEDLVPVLEADGTRYEDPVSAPGYTIHRYRPRIEGLFARIERWTNQRTSETYWRSITRDNVTTIYGRTGNSRISVPENPDRVFSWLIAQSYDDRGNAIIYRYKEENGVGVDDSPHVHEKNRTELNRSANCYIKRIQYGNRVANRDAEWHATDAALLNDGDWMFEVLFDYGEGHYTNQPARDRSQHDYALAQLARDAEWPVRQDPFSSYRAGFEVRTYRLCQRVLMFHHFRDELGVADYLVRSTEFTYAESPFASFMGTITQSGYVHAPTREQPNRYLRKSLPPLEFEYSQANIEETVKQVDSQNLENLPYGLDGSKYEWADLDGEGVAGILTEQAGGWFYKRNLSPANRVTENGSERAVFQLGPAELVAQIPAAGFAVQTQLLDLAGDGQVDLVQLNAPVHGFYERTDQAGWVTFRPFTRFPNVDTRDPNVRLIDLDGDGHTDILVSEDEVFSWYQSLAEQGFGPGGTAHRSQDEEKGPSLVFADATQSIYVADMSGDGLTDLVRIRNGEVCYWPNLGYGRFGAKVTMDKPPVFDAAHDFVQGRVRLGDIDGSGTTDIFYLGRDGVTIWRNQSGNSWSAPRNLGVLPPSDDISSFAVVDLLGNGTACLVWSSPLPGYADRPMRYIDLMGGQKPHLLLRVANNLGAETRVHYSPSTKFYVEDKLAGKPWITRLPFPVHVVDRVETYDHISRNRFVSRYTYHHGYFDGEEREFRGFGMVEQQDTEEFAALTSGGEFPTGENIDPASHVPPVLTRTWFHTGVFIDRDHISNFFAGLVDGTDVGEYYREPAWREDDSQARRRLLDDTILQAGLTSVEEREACRALKGAMLRQEVYALDGTEKAEHPYTVTEQNFSIQVLQRRGDNRHAVFSTHAREAINYHYERNPTDPRIAHTLTLKVDEFGNVVRSITIAYPRRNVPERQPEQNQTHLTLTLNRFANQDDQPNWRRIGLHMETRTYELVKPPATFLRFAWQELSDLIKDLVPPDQVQPSAAKTIPYEQWDWRKQWNPQTEPGGPVNTRLRLIEHLRTHYRPDDLGLAQNDPRSLLPLGVLEPLALPGESYKLAFTPGMLANVYERPRSGQSPQDLLPDARAVLGRQGGDKGGYTDLDNNGNWWIPSGRMFYSQSDAHGPADELAYAREHFFLPHRYLNAFGQPSFVSYDRYALLVQEARDALDNIIAVRAQNYRLLQPSQTMDPNRNCSEVAYDALGMVVGTAVMGKPEENPRRGDSLAGFIADLTQQQMDDLFHAADPGSAGRSLLGTATTRLIYDVNRFLRTRQENPSNRSEWKPVFASMLAREIHVSDLQNSQETKIQVSFSYSDGFGREIQKKLQAEPGQTPRRDPATGRIIVVDGRPQMTADIVRPRWVGSGWTIYNNNGKRVRQYEPFFTDTHGFEFDVRVGVSPVLFYDPVERVVATLHPSRTYGKVVFDSWRQETWDVNDTVLLDLGTDNNIKGFTAPYFAALGLTAGGWETWHAERISGGLGPHEQAAAAKAALHANTPGTAHFDSLGRPFLTLAHNGFDQNGAPIQYATRVHLDIEGNQRAVVDARNRVVMRYDYDMLGSRVHQASMDAGERWILNDVTGQPIRAWDSRGHDFRTEYDLLRRPLKRHVRGTDANFSDPRTLNREVLFERIEYGEEQAYDFAITLNLRTRVFRQYDGAGVVTNMGQHPLTDRQEAYDFKGNLLRTSRQLAGDYEAVPHWSDVAAVQLDGDPYRSSMRYDALNRPVAMTTPDNSVTRPTYNERNLLKTITTNLRGEVDETSFVTGIDYDAKGQRTLIDYGAGTNSGDGVRTVYEYDPLTFRLVHLLTRRDTSRFLEDCPQAPSGEWSGCQVQNLRYTYDPAGNITHIQDDAQQIVYFRNRRVEPSNDYIYDAIYRLIEATGREHLGQNGDGAFLPAAPMSYNDRPRVGLLHPADGNAMGTYLQQFVYDEVGNILEMVHRRSDPAQPNWRRVYIYNEASLTEGGFGNRLSRTILHPDSAQAIAEPYSYDTHGNMTGMPHLQIMQLDFKDHLYMTRRQAVNSRDAEGQEREVERTFYVYDSAGQRVRKVTVLAAGQLRDERVYLSRFEIYRRYGINAVVRQTLHVMDDKRRVALVEIRTEGQDRSPDRLIRYQFANHLGSVSLELDDRAHLITYEEHYPYGSTSFQTVRSRNEVPKHYSYIGKERDEESGLSHHGARYYATWLGRWTSCDPAGIADGLNRYTYTSGDPITHKDGFGMQTDPDDFSDLRPIAEEVHETGLAVGEEKPGRAGLRELPSAQQRVQNTTVNARSEGDKGADRARRYWRSPRKNPGGLGKPQPGDEMGHLSAARHNATSGIPNDIANDPRNIVAIPATDKNAQVTNPNGSFRRTDFHAAQEDVLNEIQARNQANKTQGTVESSIAAQDALEEARIKSEPFSREYSDRVKAGGLAKPEPGPPVDSATGRVIVAETESVGKTRNAINTLDVVSTAGSLLKVLGYIATLSGANSEAKKTFEAVTPGVGLNKPLAASVTFLGAVAAGLLDDALAAFYVARTGDVSAAPILDYWTQQEAGPFQVLVGSFVRGADRMFSQ